MRILRKRRSDVGPRSIHNSSLSQVNQPAAINGTIIKERFTLDGDSRDLFSIESPALHLDGVVYPCDALRRMINPTKWQLSELFTLWPSVGQSLVPDIPPEIACDAIKLSNNISAYGPSGRAR